MIYQVGDFIDTTKGMFLVNCPITFKRNDHKKYNKLGGKTLYWLQNNDCEDVLLWDNELEEILTESEKFLREHKEEEGDIYED